MQGQQVVLTQNITALITSELDPDNPGYVSIQNTSGTNVVLLGGSAMTNAATAGWSIPINGQFQTPLGPGDKLYGLCTGAGGATLNVLESP